MGEMTEGVAAKDGGQCIGCGGRPVLRGGPVGGMLLRGGLWLCWRGGGRRGGSVGWEWRSC